MANFAGETFFLLYFQPAQTMYDNNHIKILPLLGAFEKLKNSEFYDSKPKLPDDNDDGSSNPVKVATTYKAGSIMVNQRQVIWLNLTTKIQT